MVEPRSSYGSCSSAPIRLHWTVKGTRDEVTSLSSFTGRDVPAACSSMSSLLYAASEKTSGNLDTLMVLILAGSDPSLTTKTGYRSPA